MNVIPLYNGKPSFAFFFAFVLFIFVTIYDTILGNRDTVVVLVMLRRRDGEWQNPSLGLITFPGPPNKQTGC